MSCVQLILPLEIMARSLLMPARMVPSGSQSIPNEKHFRRRLTGDGALAHFAFSHNVGKRPAKVDFCRDRGIEEKFRLLRSRLLEKVSNASTRLSTGVEARHRVRSKNVDGARGSQRTD